MVQSKVELPSKKWFGFNELYQVVFSAGGIFTDNKVQCAVRVEKRYWRTFDSNGHHIVERLKIMNTYQVLDGISGGNHTSTTKFQLKLSRPLSSASI